MAGGMRYRWVVLTLAFLVNATIQALWVTYAPITLAAQDYYGVGTTAVGAFSMIFMVMFIPFSLPASWLIDRVGVRTAVGAASVAVGIGGLLRGLAGDSYAWALAATALPAIAQPVLLNSWTATVHPWFERGARTTAVSVVMLGNLIGTAVGLVLTPALIATMSIADVQLLYGAVALVAGVVFWVLMRDRPVGGETVLASEEPLAVVVRESLRLVGRPAMFVTLLVAVAALGTFNAVTTWVEPIVEPKGLDATQAGLFGALTLLGGLLGAVGVAAVCDRTGRRATALAFCLTGAAAAMIAVALTTGPTAQFVCALVLGFFLVGAAPVTIEYASELALPTSPAISSGLVQLFGQGAVVLVLLAGAAGEAAGSFQPTLYAGAIGLLLAAAASWWLSRHTPTAVSNSAPANSAASTPPADTAHPSST